MGMNVGYLTSGRTAESDEVFTPFYGVAPILKYLSKDKIYWCGFDEEWSAYYQLLKENGFQVVRSSLEEGQNFFEYEPKQWDIFISNPPFSKKDLILDRLEKLGKPYAILLPLNSLQGQKRYPYMKNIELLAFDKRIDYHTSGNMTEYTKGNSFASAYFCKGILPQPLIVEELKKYDRTLELKEDD